MTEEILRAMLAAAQGSRYFPLSSSALSGVEYSPDGTATIHFHDGNSEEYDFGVLVLLALLIAPSAGHYFNTVIRNA